MAGNMDENEIKAVAEAMNELRETGTLSAESLAKLSKSGDTAKTSLEKFSAQVLGVGQKMGGLTSQIAQGQGSFSSLGGTIEATTKMMGGLLSALPLVGGAAKALAEGVGQAAKFVLDQLDVMAKNYQTLGDASAGAVDGVDGLMRQFNQMGNYSLPAFTRAIKANTVGMAAFQGTAAQGAEELSKVAGALTTGNTAQRFLKLGMSLDAVGDATTAYIADSARYGITQGQTTEELTKKTQNYIEEVDKIARLTGQTREAQAKEAQKSLVNANFRAKLAEMTANGQTAQAEELRKYVEGLGGAAGDAARAMITGIPLTKEAAQANLFSNDALRQNTLAVQQGKKATVAIADTQQALSNGFTRFGKQIQYGGDVFGGVVVQAADYQALLKEQAKLESQGMTREQAIAAIQKKQATASGKTTDAFTSAQLATAGASKDLQSLGFSLTEAAIPAVDAFASGLKKVTGFIDENFGSGTPGGAGGNTVGGSMWEKLKNAVGLGGGGKAAGGSQNADAALKFFQSAGWTKEQAAGIVGNLQAESGKNLNTQAVGDGGKAKGVAQWHPARQADFQRVIGKDVMSSTLEEQLRFVDWELKNSEKRAGDQLKQARTAAEAARIVDKQYERSSGEALGNRIASAEALAGPRSGYQSKVASVNPSSAGAETTAQSNQASAEQQDNQSNTILVKKLDEMIAQQRQTNAINTKILQQAKG